MFYELTGMIFCWLVMVTANAGCTLLLSHLFTDKEKDYFIVKIYGTMIILHGVIIGFYWLGVISCDIYNLIF